ncbi:MAG: RagB/SusD family nutrient uptake outer membrane protein [Bacteroidota bacterium]
MKNRTYISISLIMVLLLAMGTGCEDFLDLKPYDALTAEQLLLDEQGMAGLANGSLRMMKDLLGDEANNVYVRVLYQTTEFPSDNVLIVKSTTDPLWLSFNRAHILSQENTSYLWATGYKIILNCNQIINNAEIDGSTSDEAKQYIGESYFYRGMVFFDLARLFSFPPSHGLSNKGVILRTGLGGEDAKARATVGETYRQIINDLWAGAGLMTQRSSDASKYGNKYAALGYLTRAYLFTEQYDSVVAVATDVLENSPFELEPRENYIYALQNSASSGEAMFILFHDDTENRSTGAIGSMYNGDGGWGEVFPSAPYRELVSRYPHDVRNQLLDTIWDGTSPAKYQGTSYEKIYMTKFSYQNGISTVHSPQFMRLSEVVLNRAEAYAHLGMDAEALDDVNTIRMRAGLSGDELITTGNLAAHGFASVLDAVLGERRLELAFEGHRRDDLMRNKIDLDRSFSSAQNVPGTTEIYPYNGPRQIYYIPAAQEIAYNPLCEQND